MTGASGTKLVWTSGTLIGPATLLQVALGRKMMCKCIKEQSLNQRFEGPQDVDYNENFGGDEFLPGGMCSVRKEMVRRDLVTWQ